MEEPLSKKSQNEMINLLLLCIADGIRGKACAGQNHILVGSAPSPLYIQRVFISVT